MTVVSGGEGWRALLEDYGAIRFNSATALGTETFVSYSFFDSFPTYGGGNRVDLGGTFEVIDTTQRASIRVALDRFTAISGVSFFEVPGNATTRGDLVFGMVNDIPGYSGLAYFPSDGTNRWTGSLSGEVWLSRADVGAMAVGSFGFFVAMHEIGHGIGFKHPFEDDPTLAAGDDNTANTVMTYNVSPVPSGLGAYDIQAAQYLYGTRAAADANGITGAWDAQAQRIAISGSSAAEYLLGTGWRDTIAAAAGTDTIHAGSGDDVVSGGDGNDTISGGYGNDTLGGGAGNDTLNGNQDSDVAVFTRPRWEYRFTGSTGSTNVAGLTSAAIAADGTDTLGGFEFVETAGVRVSVAAALANALPLATPTGATVSAGARRAITDFFAVSDLNGDAIQSYRLVDLSAGGGRLVRVISAGNEVDLSAGAPVILTPAQLATVVFEGGGSSGSDTIEIGLYDGKEWSQPTIAIATTGAANRAPVVVWSGVGSVDVGASVAASSLFSASDPDGQAITGYEFRDNGTGGGQFRLSGVGQAAGSAFAVAPGNLVNLVYAGGASAGSEAIDVRASDGSLWSNWTTISLATMQPNRAPQVAAGAVSSVNAGVNVAASSLFSASDPDGHAIAGYEFRDNGAGGGQFRLSGVGQAAGSAFAVAPGNLANLVYAGGASAGSETIDVRASDGSLWSNWTTLPITTLAQANGAPVIAAATSALPVDLWVQASTLFSASDPDGNAITAYRFTDLTAGGGSLWFSGAIATGTTIELATSQLSTVWFRSAVSPTSDVLRVEASDGNAWGTRDLTITTTQPNRAPLVAASANTNVAVAGSLAVASMFAVSDPDGDAITAYELWDSAGGGRFRVGGVVQPAGSAIALSPAQLATTVYEGAAAPGTEFIWMRARDAFTFSQWGIAYATTTGGPANRAPVVISSGLGSVDVGASVAASSLFSASDPDGQAITGYEFRDNGTGGGQFRLSGVGQAAGSAFAVAPGNLANLVYAGGASAGSETIDVRASDGNLWSNWTTISLATVQSNRAPVVVWSGVGSVDVGASVAASSLFSASDPDGQAITGYEFRDNGTGGGQFRLSGVGQAAGSAFAVAPGNLVNLVYAGGASAGSEAIDVRASDGSLWSNWTTISLATMQPNRAPQVAAGAVSSVNAGVNVAASSLFSASDPDGHAIAGYEFRDNGAGGGQFRLSGVGQAAGSAFAVAPGNLANLVYAGGASAGSETIDVRASDGSLWSNWTTLPITTLAQANGAPVIAAATSALPVDLWVQASTLFSASDPDGNAITAYRFTDLTAGGGSLWFSGAIATGTTIELATSQLSTVWFRSAASPTSDVLRVEASDGNAWGTRDLTITTTQPNRAPLVAASANTNVAVAGSLAVASMFAVNDPDGDAVTAYELWDSAGGGRFRVGGVVQPAGSAIALSPAQLATTVYEGAAAPGSEFIWMRAKDAFTFSQWGIAYATTTAPGGLAAAPDAPGRERDLALRCGCAECSGWRDSATLDSLYDGGAGSAGAEQAWRAAPAAGTAALAQAFAPLERAGGDGAASLVLR